MSDIETFGLSLRNYYVFENMCPKFDSENKNKVKSPCKHTRKTALLFVCRPFLCFLNNEKHNKIY